MNDLTDQTIDIEGLPNPKAHQNPMMSYDRLGRTQYEWSKYGPPVLKLRALKFGSSSAQTHGNHLAPILSAHVQDRKTIAFIKVDNSPDWNLLNITNAIYLVRCGEMLVLMFWALLVMLPNGPLTTMSSIHVAQWVNA